MPILSYDCFLHINGFVFKKDWQKAAFKNHFVNFTHGRIKQILHTK